jgi:hypothetical protein
MDGQIIARRARERRPAVEGPTTARWQAHQVLRAGCARPETGVRKSYGAFG